MLINNPGQKNKKYQNTDWDDKNLNEDEYPRRSKEELIQLLGEEAFQKRTMSPLHIVKLQTFLTILFTMTAVLVNKPIELNSIAISVLSGGLVGILPTALFTWRLSIAAHAKRPNANAFAVALVSGEFLKIVTTVGLVAVMAWKIPGLRWLPMLGMYILTLKCYLLAWFLKRKA